MIVEKSFPRGGVPAKETTAIENKRENIVFGAVQKKLKKNKVKPANEFENLSEKDDVIEAHTAELLSYDTVQDGMNIMGKVSAIDALHVTISLPGHMSARLTALDISDAYTKAAKAHLESSDPEQTNFKTLQELYEIGQLVYGRIVEVKHNKAGRAQLVMSLKPTEVHADLIHTNIRKGFTFNGAIEEIQEHGYIIETGIKGLRAFLPLEKANKDLILGQLVFLKVEKITIDKNASTCLCKQLQADKLTIKSLQSESSSNIDYILPTAIFKFQVTKCLKNGLQGTIMNEAFTAYVNEHHLETPLMMPDEYEVKSVHEARLLYVMPLTKLVYLTLNLHKKQGDQQEDEQLTLKRGDIVEKAKVHHLGTGGVVLVLNNSLKGLITYKTLKANYKGNYDQDELLSKYAQKSKHKVRILDYDMMDSLYICTDDANVVNEQTFAIDDLKPGEFVNAIINCYNKKIDGYEAQVGKVNAIIERLYLAPGGSHKYEPKAKIRCRVIALNTERNKAYLTNRPEYLAKDCKLLTTLDAAKKNQIFMGTIVKITETYYMVKFFNNIVGLLFKQHLRDFLHGGEHSILFAEGQTMPFRIYSRKDERISLALLDEIAQMGEVCTATVTHNIETGLEIQVQHKSKREEQEEATNEEAVMSKGLVPLRLLSDFQDLLYAKSKMYDIKTEFEAVCMHKNIFSIRDVAYFQANDIKSLNKIQPGDVLRAYIENVHDNIFEIFVPIRGYGKLVKIHYNMLLMKAYDNANIVLHPEQIIFVKVLSKESITKTITVSALLTDVWDKKFNSVAAYVEGYLQEVNDIRGALKTRKAAIAQFNIGEKIEVHFQGIDEETEDWSYVHKKSKVVAIAKKSLIAGAKIKPPKIDAKQEVIILWIDYSNDILLISPKIGDVKHIANTNKIGEELLTAKQVNAKVLLKLDNIFICSLKKASNPLVFCPMKLHYNDFEMSASRDVKEGDFCKLAFIHKTKPIAVLHTTWELWHAQEEQQQKIGKRKSNATNLEDKEPKLKKLKETPQLESNTKKQTKKQKALNEVEVKEVQKSKKPKLTGENEAPLFYEDKTPTTIELDNPKSTQTKKSLAGVTDFWNADLSKLDRSQQLSESSDDDDDDDKDKVQSEVGKLKKKKLSAVEKFKQQRDEESRLREIEEKYADPQHLPETVDQFDRLVLSAPNDSKNWINYMVFHLQSAEIDKARAIAARAIKTISMRSIDDHLNVWVALLNLELRYGSRESFDSTLKEALTYNEPLKVYLRVVDILREAKKNQELIEIVSVITKKFKMEQNVWKSAADAYFSVGMTEQAQQMLHKALASLPEREHVNTIVLFANLNHRHGCNEMAQTLLDQVVTSYPKRVDVWAQYVDMLAKDQLIESARNVLERALIQKIPFKKMRTIFKKYLEFEERHGTEADVEKVKRLATEYVKNNTNVDVSA